MNISPVVGQTSQCCSYKENTTKPLNRTSFKGDELDVKAPSLFNGFDGKIKGDFDGATVNFNIDQKFLKLLNKEKLSGNYTIDDGEEKKCNLEFNQKFSLANKYNIKGAFGDKKVDINFANPIIKYSKIKGSYNSKPVNIEVNRKLSNVLRNEYHLSGTINGKKVDLTCKGLLLLNGSIKGTFNGKSVEFDSKQKINLLVDHRQVESKTALNNEDKEDMLLLHTAIMINDLNLHR